VVFSTRFVPKGYKENNLGNLVNSVQESEARIFQLERSRRSART
jgi:hypothetical protein